MLTKKDLLSLEDYANKRDAIRQHTMRIKQPRSVHLGQHIRLLFENEQTIRYQIQEMLHIEKIFEADAIQEELDAYNPLIPTGNNLKATMMIEYSDPSERKQRLAELVDIEHSVYFQIAGQNPIFAVCDEDLERQNEQKTSAVHFMRFEFNQATQSNFAQQTVKIVAEHPSYNATATLTEAQKLALLDDFH